VAEKKKYIQTRLPAGTLAWSFLYYPDDKAPEGASWKPDGKFKATIVYEPSQLADLTALIKKEATEHFKGVKLDWDEFKFPFTVHDEESPRESWRNKAVLIAKSKQQPRTFDAKRNQLSPIVDAAGNPVLDDDGKPVKPKVMIRSGDIVKAVVGVAFYEKTEKVKEGKKMVDVQVKGCNLYIDGVQLIDKRSTGGSGADMFDDEDGFVAGDEPTPSDYEGTAAGAGVDDGNGDF
jgi:hypothetical protein